MIIIIQTFERNICVIVCLITVSVANNLAVKSLCKVSFKSRYGSNTDFIARMKRMEEID